MKLSVIIPYYNAKSYILETLESIVIQSVPDSEIVIIDDGSTDGGDVLIRTFLESRPDFPSIFIRTENSGANAARNTGLAAATGDWVLFLDSDDRLRPGALKALLSASNGYDAVYGDVFRMDQNGNRIGELTYHPKPFLGYLNIVDKAPITSSVLIKKSAVGNRRWANPFDCSDEFIFYSSLAIDGVKFHHISHRVLDYRVHQSADRKTSKAKDQVVSLIETYISHFERLKKENRLGKLERQYFNAVFTTLFLLTFQKNLRVYEHKLRSYLSFSDWFLLPFSGRLFMYIGVKSYIKRSFSMILHLFPGPESAK